MVEEMTLFGVYIKKQNTSIETTSFGKSIFFCNRKFICTLMLWKRKTSEIVDSCGLDQRCWHPAMFYSGLCLCQRQGPEQNIARRKHIWIRFQLNIEKTQDRYRFCASHRKWLPNGCQNCSDLLWENFQNFWDH